MGFYVGLSTNGTLIDEAMADASPTPASTTWASAWTASRATHDRFRRKEGAFDAA
jgi:MoaA/NifB/PqqE/SkfB family radical SAM enzyme